ncbi:MAG: hypothetical protein IPK83_16045 [Planctomycetes bacterium]|nr:hypothetical protein [Planctomycetota bacterium]
MNMANLDGIQAALSRRASLRKWRAVAGIVMGVPLCFVAPFLLGTLFWFSCGMLFGWHSWIWFFWVWPR